MCIIHPSFNIILQFTSHCYSFMFIYGLEQLAVFRCPRWDFNIGLLFFTGRFHEFLAFIYMFVLIKSVLFCIRVCHGCSRPNLLRHGGRVYIICYFSCVSKNACLRGIDRSWPEIETVLRNYTRSTLLNYARSLAKVIYKTIQERLYTRFITF
jgi:hypothetical protein